MNNKYREIDWWIEQIEAKCKEEQKKSEKYRKSDHIFKILCIFSCIVLVFGIAIGLLTDLQTVNLIKRIGESIETFLLFIAGILAGFTIDEYRNRATILENSSLLRPSIFKKMICDIGTKLNWNSSSKFQNCFKYIQDGASQMSKSGDEGLSALKEVIKNVIDEICQSK